MHYEVCPGDSHKKESDSSSTNTLSKLTAILLSTMAAAQVAAQMNRAPTGISFATVVASALVSGVYLLLLGIGCIVSSARFAPGTCHSRLVDAPALLVQFGCAAICPIIFLITLMIVSLVSTPDRQRAGVLEPCLPSRWLIPLVLLLNLTALPQIFTGVFIAAKVIPTCLPTTAEVVLICISIVVQLLAAMWMTLVACEISKTHGGAAIPPQLAQGSQV